MVTALFAALVGAVVGVFDVGQINYRKATSLWEAQSDARTGLDRMIGDLRLIGAFYLGFGGAGTAITDAGATRITFLGDVDADSVNGGIETTTTAAVLAGTTSIAVSGTATQVGAAFGLAAGNPALNDFVTIAGGTAGEVVRLSNVAGTNLTVATALGRGYPAGSIVRSVEVVTYTYDANTRTLTRSSGGDAAETILTSVTGLTFTYFDATGAVATDTVSIREIQVSITTRGTDGAQRTMTTRVRPRNLPA